MLTGVLCGLGLLTHPFAIVYCLQIGVWVLWASRGWKRAVGNGALLAAVALLVLALWLPLILITTLLPLRPVKALMIALQYRHKAAEGRLEMREPKS